MKDSTGNLWNKLKIDNFSMFVGSEINLIENLELNGAGCISATTNVSHNLTKHPHQLFH